MRPRLLPLIILCLDPQRHKTAFSLRRESEKCSRQRIHCLSSLKCFNLKRFVDKRGVFTKDSWVGPWYAWRTRTISGWEGGLKRMEGYFRKIRDNRSLCYFHRRLRLRGGVEDGGSQDIRKCMGTVMIAINQRICHEIRNKCIVPISGGPL